MKTPDYKPFICPYTDYDPSRIELAIDVRTLQGAIKAEIGRALFIMADGVYVARKAGPAVVAFTRWHEAGEA